MGLATMLAIVSVVSAGSLLTAWQLRVRHGIDALSRWKEDVPSYGTNGNAPWNLGFSTTSNAAFLVPTMQCALKRCTTPSAILLATALLHLTVASTAWNLHLLGGNTVFVMNDRAAIVTVCFGVLGLAFEYATDHVGWWITVIAIWSAIVITPLIIDPSTEKSDRRSAGSVTLATLSKLAARHKNGASASVSRRSASTSRAELRAAPDSAHNELPGPPDESVPEPTSTAEVTTEPATFVHAIAFQTYPQLDTTQVAIILAPITAFVVGARRIAIASMADDTTEGLSVVGEAISSLPVALFGSILQLRRGLPALETLRQTTTSDRSSADAISTFRFYDVVCGTFHVAVSVVLVVLIDVCLRSEPLSTQDGIDGISVGLTSGILLLAPIAVLLTFDMAAWGDVKRPYDQIDAPRTLIGLYLLWMVGTCFAWLVRISMHPRSVVHSLPNESHDHIVQDPIHNVTQLVNDSAGVDTA